MIKLQNFTCIATLLFTAFVACKPSHPDHQDEIPAAATEQAAEQPQTKMICYAHNSDEDLIGLTLEVNGNHFTGNIAYAVDGFDRTAGTLEGMIVGDTLIGEYTYIFGGANHVRQIAFLNQNGSLVEAYNDMVERDGKEVFRDRSALRFMPDFPLRLIPCIKTRN